MAPTPPDEHALKIVDVMLDKREPDLALRASYFDPEAISLREERERQRSADDWPALSRYREANAALAGSPELVMIGDSLTEIWQLAMPELFGPAIVNRGISGQTSPQMLLRFMPDVIDLRPRAVHILCGTNDIAGNTGPNHPDDYKRNVRAMIDLALANEVTVILASILPATDIYWRPEASPREWIAHLNEWLEELASQRSLAFLDYFAILHDGRGGLQERYSADGVHVSREAYQKMSRLLSTASRGVRSA